MKKRIRRTYRVARYVVYRQTIIEPMDHFWTFVGAFLGIGFIGYTQQENFAGTDAVFLIGSFGASAVLVFGATNSPLAQPRNLVLGHFLSAVIGVSVQLLLPDALWFSSALAVSLSIVAMQITKSMHPPGGATALIANIGSEKIKNLGFGYVFSPVMSGVMILLIVALIVNNIPRNRNYPYKRNIR
jgi:CBS domain-containing membrane protein